MLPAVALVRALAATAGDAAVRRALPVYAGLAIAGGLLFGGNGLQATTVVAGADASLLARALLWSGWLIAAGPALDALWRTPASFWLRSLPISRARHLTVLLGFSALAEAPWCVLWLAGGGRIAGLAALAGALTVHAVALARPPGLPGLVLVALALALVVLAPPLLLALGSWPIVLVAFRRAWSIAPVHDAREPLAVVRGPAPLALALAHLASLARAHLPVLLRAALLTALAAAAAWLAARNNATTDLADLSVYAAGFFAPAALLAGSSASAPLLAGESRAAGLLLPCGPRTRLAAHALAAASLGALLALPAAAALARAWDLAPAAALLVLAALLATGAGLATLAALLTRWAARFGTRAAGRQILALLLALVAALAALSALGPIAPPAWLLAALLAYLFGHVLSATSSTHPTGGAPVLLTMTAVRKRLGTRVILDDVHLACPPAANTLVLGQNGAGKSTLLRVAAGVLEPDAGTVTLAGAPLADPGTRRNLGYAPDTADAFPDLSVRELLTLVAALKRADPPPAPLRDRLGLAAVWHQRLRTLSFGQVKRTYLLAALVGDPPLLILDEPSNGLDPAGAATLADLLRERAAAGHAALVATNDAAFADRLAATRHRLAAARLHPEPTLGLGPVRDDRVEPPAP